MKLRTGFVSNSSSSSFVLDKNKLSTDQIHMIMNHVEFGKKFAEEDSNLYFDDDPWSIEVSNNLIMLDTWMDNFDMLAFLILISAEDSIIERYRSDGGYDGHYDSDDDV